MRAPAAHGVMRVALLAVAALACALALPGAHARDGVWYLGAGAGLMNAQGSISKFSLPAITCRTAARPLRCDKSGDDNAASVSAFGGYEFNENFALEVGYANLPGSYDVRLVDPNFPAPAQIDVQQDSETVFVRGVATLPLRGLSGWPALDRVSVSGVLGLNHWRTDTSLDIDLTGVAGGFRSAARRSASGNELTFGARISYDVTDAVRVSAAWDRYQDLGNSPAALFPPLANPNLPPFVGSPVNTVSEDVDVFSLNLIYRF